MATQDAGELAELRRRAYGPDADIDADADARRPLQELEAELREPVSAPAAPSEDAWPDELSSLLDDPPPEVAAPSAVAPTSPTPTRSSSAARSKTPTPTPATWTRRTPVNSSTPFVG